MAGRRSTLTAEVDLPPNAHVYAPGVKSYKPIQMILDPIPELKPGEPRYPKSKVLFLPAIQESVPVFDGRFRISEDAAISAGEFVASLGAGRTVSVHGKLSYPVCDTNKCYLPEKAKVLWEAGGAAGPEAVAGTDPAQVGCDPAIWARRIGNAMLRGLSLGGSGGERGSLVFLTARSKGLWRSERSDAVRAPSSRTQNRSLRRGRSAGN